MIKLQFIIPMHRYKECVEEAIQSIKKQPSINDFDIGISVVGPKEELDKIKDQIIERIWSDCGEDNSEPLITSYQNLSNLGIKTAINNGVDWVSILEYDDILTPNSMRVFKKYSKTTKASVLAGMSAMVEKLSDGEERLLSIGNEGSYAPGMSEEFGKFDFGMMLRNNFLFVNGLFLKSSIFEEIGYLKPSFDMYCDYEFALRMVYNGIVVAGLPKLTHFHRITQDGMYANQKGKSQEESEFWLTSARKEYFFNEDRNIEYSME